MLIKILEYALIVVLAAVSLAVIVAFFVYTGLDKRRFRIDRQLDKVLPLVKKWLEFLGKLSGAGVVGCGEVTEACRAFLATKKLHKRLDALAVLAEHYRTLSCRLGVEMTGEQAEVYAEMQDIKGMLCDFFSMYPIMSEDYNGKLAKPVYSRLGRLMGFRKAPDLKNLEKI